MNTLRRLNARGLVYAVLASAMWHFFWLFAITIDITPFDLWKKKKTSIHFIGPVLDDAFFERILESRTELSETVYRTYEELERPLDIEPGQLDRDLKRDLVHIPMTRRHASTLKGFLKTEKKFPLSFFAEALPVPSIVTPYPISGALTRLNLLYAPPAPEFENYMGDPDLLYREAVFEMSVTSEGKVKDITNIVSTGEAEIDMAWKAYLEKWQFMRPAAFSDAEGLKGRVRVQKVLE